MARNLNKVTLIGNIGRDPEVQTTTAGKKLAHISLATSRRIPRDNGTVQAAETLLGGLIERFQMVALQYRRLKATRLPEPDFTRLVLDEVAPDPRRRANFNPEARTAELVLARAERKRTEIRQLWDEGTGHTGDRSAWEAYNAVAEAIDHNAELWPVRSGAYRTASLLDGHLLTLKQNVLANLSRYTLDWTER